jgi:hypothetical protein
MFGKRVINARASVAAESNVMQPRGRLDLWERVFLGSDLLNAAARFGLIDQAVKSILSSTARFYRLNNIIIGLKPGSLANSADPRGVLFLPVCSSA